MKYFLKQAHHYYFKLTVALLFILLYPLLYVYSRKPFNFRGMNLVRWLLAYLSSSASGIFYRYTFEEEIDWSKPYIICPNHTSNLDITSVILLSKNQFVFLGKDDLLDNFVTGLYFKTIDIPLNRESKMSSYRAFKRAQEYLKSGISVAIFPEGLISNDYPPVLYPFKNGPFRLAIEQGIPILPVSICDNWKLMWDDGKKYGSKPGLSNIYVHKPVQSAHYTIDDAELLRDEVYNIIYQKLNGYGSIPVNNKNPGQSLIDSTGVNLKS